MRRVRAVARWHLACTTHSLTLIPPIMVVASTMLVALAAGPAPLAPAVTTDRVVLFVVSVWMGLAPGASLAPGHRAVTRATAGPGAAFAGELLAGAVLVACTSTVLVGWRLVLHVISPPPGPGAIAAAFFATTSAGLAGLALATMIDAGRVAASARIVVAAAMVALTLARPSLHATGSAVAAVPVAATPGIVEAAVVAPPPDRGWPGADAAPEWQGVLGCLAWSGAALALAGWLQTRRGPGVASG